jgi:hypothetical protein
MRCQECGEVRWSILGRAEEISECPACGGEMVEERRHPGRRSRARAERRDAPLLSGKPPVVPPRIKLG